MSVQTERRTKFTWFMLRCNLTSQFFCKDTIKFLNIQLYFSILSYFHDFCEKNCHYDTFIMVYVTKNNVGIVLAIIKIVVHVLEHRHHPME